MAELKATVADDAFALLELIASEASPRDGWRVSRGTRRPYEKVARRIEADQTNESWVVDETVIIKITTEDVPGPHPAGDRIRRLLAADFRETPPLWGIVERLTETGHWVPVATAQDFVTGAEDGWTWCVDEARIALGVRSDEAQPFAAELGRLAADMHLALAEGDLVLGHGDFHVGQILRAPGGPLFVVDFDGNPTLSPQERCMARPAAYDIAHMLLSLENVGYVVRKYNPEVTAHAIAEWTAVAQAAFLAAYRGSAGHLLDESLLEPMMIEQIRRELDYADQHLPRWRYVPEAAMARRGLS